MRASAATPVRSSLAIWPGRKDQIAGAHGRRVRRGRQGTIPHRTSARRAGRLLPTIGSASGIAAELRDRLIAGDDVGAVILPHVVQRIFVRVPVRRGHGVRQHVDLVVEVEGVDHGVLDAGLRPGAGEVEPLDVELAQHGIEPGRVEGAVVLLADLEVARLRIELVHDLGIGRADDAVRPVDLEVLVDRHFLGEEIVLDEDDVDAFARGRRRSPAAPWRTTVLESSGSGSVGLLLKKPLSRSMTMTALRLLTGNLRNGPSFDA